ncbi:aldo/keto reductase family protein [Roseiconus lacunae]|uniref:aldo/keto reductase family protein n=1 Tax=Roseiconus lacunae TaxID=2605694 RepID=UPI001E3881B3|nr:aldo/keto reductase [Roseiconus lacunae]MCD0458682.1 aldo/keto reductase [Roseiconus lacunae]
MPDILYGTSHKGDETERLVRQALEAGFQGLDSANQRKHYYEAAVGSAVRKYLSVGVVHRADLFLQSKFTFPNGHDHRIPYSTKATVGEQVRQSFDSSLNLLGVDRLDSYLLHAPETPGKLSERDFEAWDAIVHLKRAGRVGLVGVSNVNEVQLQALVNRSSHSLDVVQNRCHWNSKVRRICQQHQIHYQGFSILRVNLRDANSHPIRSIAHRHRVTVAQVLLRFCQCIGIVCLTSTSNVRHMQESLRFGDCDLSADDIRIIKRITTGRVGDR